MFTFTYFSLIVLFTSGCHSWVFNNVDFKEMATRNLEFNYDMEDGNDDLDMQERVNLIFPGTKWCGAGNIADDDDDLGSSKDTDKCCRDHDHCPDTIEAGETKHNLTNTAFYTRLSCECDEKFRQCLRKVDSITSRIIGKTYFNTIGTKCFKNAYPVTGCLHKGGWLNTKCLEYSFDENGEKRYQWFDVPNYNSKL